MPLLLKDCGLEGFRGSVQRCPGCERVTVHFSRPGRPAVCGVCADLHAPAEERAEPLLLARVVGVTYLADHQQRPNAA